MNKKNIVRLAEHEIVARGFLSMADFAKLLNITESALKSRIYSLKSDITDKYIMFSAHRRYKAGHIYRKWLSTKPEFVKLVGAMNNKHPIKERGKYNEDLDRKNKGPLSCTMRLVWDKETGQLTYAEEEIYCKR
jgi:hypothetical protein